MKQIFHILVAMELLCFAVLAGCTNGKVSNSSAGDTHVSTSVHDTIRIGSMPDGEFVYNLPCSDVAAVLGTDAVWLFPIGAICSDDSVWTYGLSLLSETEDGGNVIIKSVVVKKRNLMVSL